jgi:ferredoxin
MSEAPLPQAPHLRLNPTRCDGAGYCAELVPELIWLDDWGYPVIDGRPIPEGRLRQLAARAVQQCPRVALQLTAASSRR